MSVSNRLKKYLDENKIKYTVSSHSQAFTAQEIAARMHIHGKELVKTVILNADGKVIMAVLPATKKIDFEKLCEQAGFKKIELAAESQFRDLFPDSQVGAMPPFGNLYQIPVYLDAILAEDKEIYFNAGSHTEAIQMDYADFERLVKPTRLTFVHTK